MDLHDILTRPEGKTVEFKRDLSSPRHILRTVVAFANSAGGSIVIGVDDTRTVVGVRDALDAEERLASIVADGIAPRLAPEIELRPWRDLQLLAVTVHPGPSRPYSVRAEGPDQGVYIRIGSTNRHADAALIAELGRTARGECYDELPVPDAATEDLDLPGIVSAFAAIRPIGQRDLATLRLVTEHQGVSVPTVGGLLLFARDRGARFPDAQVRGARFKGPDRRTIIDSKDFEGSLPEQLEQAMAFAERHISSSLVVGRGAHEVRWEYPLVAIREALTNAIVHADYSQIGAPVRLSVHDDRVEIENPGTLLPGLTVPDVLAGTSRLRNRVIGRVFRELRLIEQWGSGVRRMVAACRDAGLPDPVLEEHASSFRVTLRAFEGGTPQLDEIDRALVTSLGHGAGQSTSELAVRVGRTSRAVRTRLARLVELGLVVEVGSGPNDPHRAYFVAEERGAYRSGG